MTWTPEISDLLAALSGKDLAKEERESLVYRLRQLHVPRVDFVDRGAVPNHFLIRKREEEMAQIGNPIGEDVQKASTKKKMEMSPEAKAAAMKLLQAAHEKLGYVLGMVKDSAEKPGGGAAYPAEMQKGVAEVMKMLGECTKGEGDAKKGKADKQDDEEEEKAEKGKKAKAEDEEEDGKFPFQKSDGSIDLGNGLVLSGELATMASSVIEKAGRRMSGKRLAEFRKTMASLVKLWKEVDPDSVGDQIKSLLGDVEKRFDVQGSTMAEIQKSLANINAKLEAGEGKPQPATVADGQASTGEQTVKKSAFKKLPPNSDITKYLDRL